MPNAKEMKPAEAGLFLSLTGPPGSGKTHFARSALRAVSGQKFVFIAPAAETVGYAGLDVEYEQLVDPEWSPSGAVYKTEAWGKLLRQLTLLEKGDPKLLVFDTMNFGPSEACWRTVMQDFGTDDPRTLGGNARQPYVTYRSRFTELMNRLDLLRFRKKCHIICLWHEDVRELPGQGTPRKEQEKDKTVLRWDVARLSMLIGSLREDINGWFDMAFYAEAVPSSNPFRCRLLTVPDQTRLAKTRLPIYSVLQGTEVPNDFPKLLEVVTKAMGGGGK